MIADRDGATLRAYLESRGGRTGVRIGRDNQELATGRHGTVTSFSSGGLTAFGHQLKPDVGAPGGQILSSTLGIAGGPFASYIRRHARRACRDDRFLCRRHVSQRRLRPRH